MKAPAIITITALIAVAGLPLPRLTAENEQIETERRVELDTKEEVTQEVHRALENGAAYIMVRRSTVLGKWVVTITHRIK